eukprot:UN06552
MIIFNTLHILFENTKQQNVNFYGPSLQPEKDYKDNLINQDNNSSIILNDSDNE